MQKCTECAQCEEHIKEKVKPSEELSMKHAPIVNSCCMWPFGFQKIYICDQSKSGELNERVAEWKGAFCGLAQLGETCCGRMTCCGSWWEWEGGDAQAVEADCWGTPFFPAPAPSQNLWKPYWFSLSFCSSPNAKQASWSLLCVCLYRTAK